MWYGSFMTDVTRTDNFMRSLGVEAYRVGGSVRDELLGRKVKDCDYMVRGVTLKGLTAILDDKGERWGLLKDRERRPLGVRLLRGGIEITLPRVERSTGPGHRDFDIELTPDLPLVEDAKRRDFTFNALYRRVWDASDDVIHDPTSTGLYDLQHRLVRTTYPGSFREDPLRTLRALRFVATLGYDLTEDTLAQMREHAPAVDGLTADGFTSGTVFDEFDRILMSPDAPKALRIAASTGVLAVAMPELAPMIGFAQESRYHDLTTDEHTFKALETAVHVEASQRVRWALLFHDSGKPATAWTGSDGRKHYYKAKQHDSPDLIDPFDGHVQMDHEEYGEILWREAAARMNVPRRLREEVATLIRHHMVTVVGKVKSAKVRRARVKFGDDMLRDLYLHRMCDITGKGKPSKSHLTQIAALEMARQTAALKGVPSSTKGLEIGGRDLIAAGITDGDTIGRVLRTVLDQVVVEPTDLTRSREWQMEQALKLARGDA